MGVMLTVDHAIPNSDIFAILIRKLARYEGMQVGSLKISEEVL
jgi:hypothetical protein